MANVASTYWSQERWDDAIKVDEDLLEASIRLFGEEYPDILTTTANLVSIHRKFREGYAKSQAEYGKSQNSGNILKVEHKKQLEMIAEGILGK
jgi:hypothetical protein